MRIGLLSTMLVVSCCGDGGERPRQDLVAAPGVPWAVQVKGTKLNKQVGLPESVIDPKSLVVFRLVPPGEATLGVPEGTARVFSERGPKRVVITKPFYLGETEITWAEWERVMGPVGKGTLTISPDEPMWASYAHARRYCEKTGSRLPTEDEWEYACRWGTTGLRYGELGQVAACHSTRPRRGPVRSRAPNRLGLYDMIGSVYEVCETDASGVDGPPVGMVVARGGSFDCDGDECRATARAFVADVARSEVIGFRVARDP